MLGDKSVIVTDKAAHHAISAKFDKSINPGEPLVVKPELKLQQGLDCDSAHLKLPQGNNQLHREEFSNAAPYCLALAGMVPSTSSNSSSATTTPRSTSMRRG